MDSQQNEPQPSSVPGLPGPLEVTVRSAPKFWPFMITGAVVGVVAALLTAYTGEESAQFTRGTVFSFFAVGFGLLGAALAGVVYLVVDRVLLKRARPATVVPLEDSDES